MAFINSTNSTEESAKVLGRIHLPGWKAETGNNSKTWNLESSAVEDATFLDDDAIVVLWKFKKESEGFVFVREQECSEC